MKYMDFIKYNFWGSLLKYNVNERTSDFNSTFCFFFHSLLFHKCGKIVDLVHFIAVPLLKCD